MTTAAGPVGCEGDTVTKFRVGAALLALVFLSGCAGIKERDPKSCAALGAVLLGGAGTAAAASTGDDEDTGIVMGAAAGGALVGAGLGYLICSAMQPEPAPPPPPPAPAPEPPPPAPAPEPEPEPAAGPDPCTERVAFGGVNFDFNKATIVAAATPVLEQWAGRLAQCGDVGLQIEGHTDSVGPEAYNQTLSERRANSVKDFLVSQGIDAGRVNAVGYGETRPLTGNADADGRAQNRRVEIVAQ